jgi:hypothetical protein
MYCRQAQWLKAVVDNRVIIVLASPTTVENIIAPSQRYNQGLTVFGMELVALMEAGYTQWGRLMFPPTTR